MSYDERKDLSKAPGLNRSGAYSHVPHRVPFRFDIHTLSTAQTDLGLRGFGPSGNRMRRSRPLAEAHPELLVIDTPGLSREYRVENGHLTRRRRGRVISGLPWISIVDVFSVMLAGLLWPSVRSSLVCISFLGGLHRWLAESEYNPGNCDGNRVRPACISEGHTGPLGYEL